MRHAEWVGRRGNGSNPQRDGHYDECLPEAGFEAVEKVTMSPDLNDQARRDEPTQATKHQRQIRLIAKESVVADLAPIALRRGWSGDIAERERHQRVDDIGADDAYLRGGRHRAEPLGGGVRADRRFRTIDDETAGGPSADERKVN